MNIKDLSKLESLEKRLSELESQKKKNLLAFGRSYS
nr:MAG TPA: Polymerase cofactor VP35 cofactor, coiled coil, oligomerization.01A [Bacteriophage sp.]